MNFFKLLGNLGNLQKLQQEMQDLQQEIGKLRFEGKAGGDMVVVQVDGTQRVVAVTIDSKLIEDRERELIEELVATAVNQALSQAKKTTAEIMQKKMAERLDMPELANMMAPFLPK